MIFKRGFLFLTIFLFIGSNIYAQGKIKKVDWKLEEDYAPLGEISEYDTISLEVVIGNPGLTTNQYRLVYELIEEFQGGEVRDWLYAGPTYIGGFSSLKDLAQDGFKETWGEVQNTFSIPPGHSDTYPLLYTFRGPNPDTKPDTKLEIRLKLYDLKGNLLAVFDSQDDPALAFTLKPSSLTGEPPLTAQAWINTNKPTYKNNEPIIIEYALISQNEGSGENPVYGPSWEEATIDIYDLSAEGILLKSYVLEDCLERTQNYEVGEKTGDKHYSLASWKEGSPVTTFLTTNPFDLALIEGNEYEVVLRNESGIFTHKLSFEVSDVFTYLGEGIPRIILKKSVDKEHPKPGDKLNYTISYTNKGFVDAHNVAIVDYIPQNTTYLGTEVKGNPNRIEFYDGEKWLDKEPDILSKVKAIKWVWNPNVIAANDRVEGSGPDEGTIAYSVTVGKGKPPKLEDLEPISLTYEDAEHNSYGLPSGKGEKEVQFERKLSGEKVGQHKVPPTSPIEITISAEVSSAVKDAFLIDYFPHTWEIINPQGGEVSPYNETHNQIVWEIGNIDKTVSKSYTLQSPERTLPATKYYFQTELTYDTKSAKSKQWMVIVADPIGKNKNKAEITPNNVSTGSTGNEFIYSILTNVTGGAMIDKVEIDVPGTFGPPTVTEVTVDGSSVYPDGIINYTTGNTISVFLTDDVDNKIVIAVTFTSDAPTSDDPTGKDFTSTVYDGEDFEDTIEEDGDDQGDGGDWTVTTTTNAVSRAVAEITPNHVITNSTGNSFTYSIYPTISSYDTGVDEVKIVIPSTSPAFGAPTVTDVKVGDSLVAYTDYTSGYNINVKLTTKVTTTQVIAVIFTSDAPTADDSTGKDFTSTVDDTTTPSIPAQDTTEGDGDNDGGADDNNDWTVTTGPAQAVSSAKAELSPNSVITGSTGNTFAYSILPSISAIDTGVDKVEIVIPSTFGAPAVTGVTVDGATVSYTDNTAGSHAISIKLGTEVTSNKVVEVAFTSNAPSSEDATGKDFTSTVDDTSTPSVGPQATTEGDGDNDPDDNNSWRVKAWTINKTGIANIVEDAITPGASLNLELKDIDLNRNTGGSNDTVSVTVTTTNGDSVAVTLNETSIPGTFSGSLSTTSNATPNTGNSILEIAGGDIITLTYLDAEDEIGNTNIDRTDICLSITSTGIANIVENYAISKGTNTGSATMGSITLEVANSDLSGDKLEVKMKTSYWDYEVTNEETGEGEWKWIELDKEDNITLEKQSLGYYKGTINVDYDFYIDTTGGGKDTQNGQIDAVEEDKITIIYNDSGTERIDEATVISGTGEVDIVLPEGEYSINPGDTLNLEIIDADLNNLPGGSNDTVDVKITSTGGDEETVTLKEGNDGGIFSGTLTTSLITEENPLTKGNDNLEVTRGERITLTYTDEVYYDWSKENYEQVTNEEKTDKCWVTRAAAVYTPPEQSTGEQPTGEQPTGEQSTGEQPGEQPTGEYPVGELPAEELPVEAPSPGVEPTTPRKTPTAPRKAEEERVTEEFEEEEEEELEEEEEEFEEEEKVTPIVEKKPEEKKPEEKEEKAAIAENLSVEREALVLGSQPPYLPQARMSKARFDTKLSIYGANELFLVSQIDPAPQFLPQPIPIIKIKAREYTRLNLESLLTSGMGLPLEYAPLIKREAEKKNITTKEVINKILKEYAKLTNLSKIPSDIYPIFAEYSSGEPRLSSPRWKEETFEKILNPGALGQALLKETFWAKKFLKSNRGEYLGKNDLEGFLGLVLTLQMENKLAFLKEIMEGEKQREYFPRKIEPVIKGGKISYKVIDESSDLFDQVSLLWGLSEFRGFSNPRIKDNYDQLFGEDRPFSLETQNLSLKLAEQIFKNIEKRHYNKKARTLVNSSEEQKISTVNAGLSIAALKTFFNNFQDKFGLRRGAKKLIIRQANFLLEKLQSEDGSFYREYLPDLDLPEVGPKDLASQGAGIRGLAAAYNLTNQEKYLRGAKKGFKYLEEHFWDDNLKVYRSELPDKYIYTPLNMGLVLGALRELNPFHPHFSSFFEKVFEEGGLQSLKKGKNIVRGKGEGQVLAIGLEESPLLASVLISEIKIDPPLGKIEKKKRVYDVVQSDIANSRFTTALASYGANELFLLGQREGLSGIKAREYSRYNLKSLFFQSGLGVSLKYAPLIIKRAKEWGITPQGFLRNTLKDYLNLANLDKFPPGLHPIFLEYRSGNPRLGNQRWEEKSFDKTVTPAALGQSLREQVFWAGEFLGSNHGKGKKYLGKNDLEGFLGLVLVLEMENKIAFLNQSIVHSPQIKPKTESRKPKATRYFYFPHKIEPILKEGKISYRVIDKSSNLFDQISLLWGLSEYRRFSNPKIKDNYDQIFGKDRPFSLESQKVVTDLAKKIFDNLEKIHYDRGNGRLNVSTINAGLSIVALKSLFDNFADEQEWQKEIKELIIKVGDLIINKLQNKEGGFNPPTLAAQGAAIQGLLAAHRVSEKKKYLVAAKKGFNFLEKNYWDNTLQIYRSEREDKYVYTPLNVGLLLGALRELGSPSRIDTFLERVLEKAGLQVLPGRKELAPVLLSEIKLTYPLNKKKGRVVAQIGNTVTYKLVVENEGELAREVTVSETLPKGFTYLSGTTKINGEKGNEPQGRNPYEWRLGDLKSGTKVALTYHTKVGFEAKPGRNESSVIVSEINSEGVRAITPPVKSEVIVQKPRLKIRKGG